MKRKVADRASWAGLKTGRVVIAAMLGIALILFAGSFVQLVKAHPASQPMPASPTPTSPSTTEPQYHKKALVFKRVLAESEKSSIRTTAQSDGYMALSAIPHAVVGVQGSIRIPQFPNNTALRNFQALSTLGTQQYYINSSVQIYLDNLKTKWFLDNLSYQQSMTDLNNRLYWNNFETQQYLNEWNLNNSVQFLNNFNNDLNNQTYLNNWNFNNSMQNLNNFNSFSSPQIYTPPPTFNFQPMPQIYIPPPTFNFP
jgi:hypothetical protein